MRIQLSALIMAMMACGCTGSDESDERITATSDAIHVLAGTWMGHESFVGPPENDLYDHDTSVTLSCDGAEGTGWYYYPSVDYLCESTLYLRGMDGDTFVYDDVSTTAGCHDGIVSLTPIKTDGVEIQWNIQGGGELSVGVLKHVGSPVCP